jgi:hypothetical protein
LVFVRVRQKVVVSELAYVDSTITMYAKMAETTVINFVAGGHIRVWIVSIGSDIKDFT